MSALGLRERAVERLRRRSAPAGTRLPLATLRMRLDDGSQGARWPLNPDGVLGRALMLGANGRATFPLRLTGPATLAARVQLLPHDWRDGRGHVRVTVHAADRDEPPRELWSAALHAGDRGRPRGRELRCTMPATTTALTLAVAAGPAQEYAVARAVWMNPALVLDGLATPPARAVPRPEPPSEADSRTVPLVSVLVPVHDPPPQMLEEAIASVIGQTFAGWELCLVDDGSRDPAVIAALERHAAADPRIHLTRHEQAQGISAATNTALGLATGRFVATLDHDDTLTPDALAQVAARVAAEPDLDMVYSDEDIVGGGGLIERHLKPGWSPEHMDALMYTCHLGVYRRSLAVELGGFQTRFDGCQDYDFVLRLAERTDRIAHIPGSLYHWRAHAASTAGGDQAKPYAYMAQPGAISEHLDRQAIAATVQFSQFPGLHRVVHAVDPATTAALVMAPAGIDGLADAAAGWLRQSHPTWSAVLAASPALVEPLAATLAAAGVPEERITIVEIAAGTAAPDALTAAANAADAERLVLMQSPAVGVTHDWLGRLIGYAGQTGIAAAGPVLLSGDGRVAQSGIAIPEGVPLHLHHGSPPSAAPPVVYNFSAVSGILATPWATWSALGGLDPAYAELALIDYCLRARTAGERTVLVPDARLRLTVADPVVNDLVAMAALRQAWTAAGSTDPYYNARYRTDRGDFTLRSYD